MEFENGNKLKGYLNNESKRLNIHSNYAYTYYFIRKFLERLYRNNQDVFSIKGSIAQLSHTIKITRAITDVDMTSYLDTIDAAYLIEKEASKNEDAIKFRVKDKFTTQNGTVNFKILCNFDYIQHMIKIDLKKDESNDLVKKGLPIVMKKDTIFDISTIPLEKHIATKMYILLRNADKSISVSKETRRLKDFYDLHFLLHTNYNEELVCKYFEQICKERNDVNLEKVDIELLDSNFIKNNNELYLQDKKRYGFNDIEFEQLVLEARDEISKRLR